MKSVVGIKVSQLYVPAAAGRNPAVPVKHRVFPCSEARPTKHLKKKTHCCWRRFSLRNLLLIWCFFISGFTSQNSRLTPPDFDKISLRLLSLKSLFRCLLFTHCSEDKDGTRWPPGGALTFRRLAVTPFPDVAEVLGTSRKGSFSRLLVPWQPAAFEGPVRHVHACANLSMWFKLWLFTQRRFLFLAQRDILEASIKVASVELTLSLANEDAVLFVCAPPPRRPVVACVLSVRVCVSWKGEREHAATVSAF